jgi:hypothetical protein
VQAGGANSGSDLERVATPKARVRSAHEAASLYRNYRSSGQQGTVHEAALPASARGCDLTAPSIDQHRSYSVSVIMGFAYNVKDNLMKKQTKYGKKAKKDQ